MNIKPIRKSIFFQFEDQVKNGHFVDSHSSGIIIDAGMNHGFSTHYSRVGKVVGVGPDVVNVKDGDRIAIKTLMWTDSSTVIDGVKFWMTDETHVLGIVG